MKKEFKDQELWVNGVKIRTPESARERSRIEMNKAWRKARVQTKQYLNDAFSSLGGARGVVVLLVILVVLLLIGLWSHGYLSWFFTDEIFSEGDVINFSCPDVFVMPGELPQSGAH